MGWLQSFMGRRQAAPSPKEVRSTEDPFNFLMDQYLRFNQGAEAPLLAATRQRFTSLSSAAVEQLWREVVEAYNFAAARQYDVRDGALAPERVAAAVAERFPQLDAENMRALLAQTQTGSYR